MVKKLLLYIFLASLCQTILSANFKYSYKDITFNCKTLNDSTVEITSWNRSAKNVVIPATVTDKLGRIYNVSTLDVYSSGDNYTATGLIIEEGIRNIDNRCFENFRSLKDTIDLPRTLANIGKDSFRNVKNYHIMRIPTEDVRALLVNSGIEPSKLPAVPHQAPDTIIITAQTLVVKAVSLKSLGIIGVRADQKKDFGDFPCALLKVSLARNDHAYSSTNIPDEEEYNQMNIEGYDKIWMIDGSKDIRIYSTNNSFESANITFHDVNPEIGELQGGIAYELTLTLEKKE